MADLTQIDGGNAAVYKREGTYYARIRVDGKYVHRTLKTGDLATAVKAAQKLVHQFEFSVANGIPVSAKKFSDVIDEYVEYRQRENEHGRTSDGMLRQIERVVRFWHAYAGRKLISAIGDKELRDYVQWRRDYYTQRPNEAKKRNVRPNPTDKTLQFDLMVCKAIIAWANERGYRGKLPLPTYTFTPKKKRVRPAFENGDYRGVLHAIDKWIRDCENPQYLHTRQLLEDYVVILARSGMRVGEANNLKVRDVIKFVDRENRINYRFIVRGKTGERDVIPVVSVVPHVERVLAQKGEKPNPDEWFFAMAGGSKIISLADQFDKVLKMAARKTSASGENFSLYSLRHYYAVIALRNGIGIYDVARNMGTSVDMIQQYYGKQATPKMMATTLGGKLKDTHKLNTGAN
jgi:integrase